MGYTHYWNCNFTAIKDPAELESKFKSAVDIIKTALKKIRKNPFLHRGQAGGGYDEVPCIICGGLGIGDPEITNTGIWFNGNEETEMDHETFSIQIDPENEEDYCNFCKTARKPYDLLVCIALLAFRDAFHDPKIFSFSSDGDDDEWATAIKLYQEISETSVEKAKPEIAVFVDGGIVKAVRSNISELHVQIIDKDNEPESAENTWKDLQNELPYENY